MIQAVIAVILFFFLNPTQALASSLQLNELMPHPSSGSDWIELYNPTSSNIDLTNWTLVDTTSTMKALSGTISSNGFVTFDVSNRLNNGGDSIYLKDSSGSTIDNYSYSSDPGIDKSVGRSPDGGSWTTLTSSSKGSSNGGAVSTSSPTPSSTPSTTPSSSSSSSSSYFTIYNVPSQINSDQSFIASVNLSLPNNPSTVYYLTGAFKKVDGTRYFGLTKTGSVWVQYSSSNYLNQYRITTDGSGEWRGNLEVKPDETDSDYKGTGDYIFKAGRYTSSGSGPSWSNESTIKIIAISSQGANSTLDSATTSVNPSPTSSSSQTKTSSLALPKPKSKLDYQIASVAAATASSSPVSGVGIKGTKFPNFLPWIGAVLLTFGIGSLIFIYLRSRKNV